MFDFDRWLHYIYHCYYYLAGAEYYRKCIVLKAESLFGS